MGVEAGRAVRARRRASAARAGRLSGGARAADAASTGGAAARRGSVREVRRWMRARDTALQAAIDAEARAGVALVGLAAHGPGLTWAATRVGITRGVARRLVAAASSTAERIQGVKPGLVAEPEARAEVRSRRGKEVSR